MVLAAFGVVKPNRCNIGSVVVFLGAGQRVRALKYFEHLVRGGT